MPISINPTVAVITAQGAASGVVLQPGTVINAQVLKILAGDLVQIAIANLSIDVLSEIPLQAGQNLQLAVSQTQDGIRLAVVGQGAGAASGGAPVDTVTLAPGATLAPPGNAAAVANPSASAAPSVNALTPLERSAVSAAVQTAATQQGSLAPLFANLGVVASPGGLPPALQQAVAQVLAQRSSLDQNLTGDDVRNAFESSGLFLEASLASGSASTASAMPDLKAALIVLRQTLLSSLDTAEGPAVAATIPSQSAAPTVTDAAASNEAAMPHAAAVATTPAPSPSVEIETQEIILPQIVSSATLLDAGAALAASARHLLDDTDAAIARQTLLQVASLPGQVDTTASRLDPAVPRWNFEVPFATPQGTAMVQFEISRDGVGSETEAAKRAWRARFSLDIEPAGPVHAMVSLSGERTSVRMWAERPATAEQLQAGVSQLSQA